MSPAIRWNSAACTRIILPFSMPKKLILPVRFVTFTKHGLRVELFSMDDQRDYAEEDHNRESVLRENIEEKHWELIQEYADRILISDNQYNISQLLTDFLMEVFKK